MGGTDVKIDGCAALWFFGPIHLALSKLHGHEISTSKPTAHLERCNTCDVTVILHLWPLMKNTCADLNFLCVLSWTKNKAEELRRAAKRISRWLPVTLKEKAGQWSRGMRSFHLVGLVSKVWSLWGEEWNKVQPIGDHFSLTMAL